MKIPYPKSEAIPTGWKFLERSSFLKSIAGYYPLTINDKDIYQEQTIDNFGGTMYHAINMLHKGDQNNLYFSYGASMVYFALKKNNPEFNLSFGKWIAKNKAEKLIHPEHLKHICEVLDIDPNKPKINNWYISCDPEEIYNHFSTKHFASCYAGPTPYIERIFKEHKHTCILKCIKNDTEMVARSWVVEAKDGIIIQAKYGNANWRVVAQGLADALNLKVYVYDGTDHGVGNVEVPKRVNDNQQSGCDISFLYRMWYTIPKEMNKMMKEAA